MSNINDVEEILRNKLCDPSGARLHLKEINEDQFITADNKLIINRRRDNEFELVLNDKILTKDLFGVCYGMRGLIVSKSEIDYIRSIVLEPESIGFKFSSEFLTNSKTNSKNQIISINTYQFELGDPSACPFTLNNWSNSLLRVLAINVQHYCGCHLDFSSHTYTLAKEMYFLHGVFNTGVSFQGQSQNAIITKFLNECFTWPIIITGLNESQIQILKQQCSNYKRYNIFLAEKEYKNTDVSKNIYVLSTNKDAKAIDEMLKKKLKRIWDISVQAFIDIGVAFFKRYLEIKVLS